MADLPTDPQLPVSATGVPMAYEGESDPIIRRMLEKHGGATSKTDFNKAPVEQYVPPRPEAESAAIAQGNKDNRWGLTRGLLSGIDQSQGMLSGAVGLAGSLGEDMYLPTGGLKNWGYKNFQKNEYEASLNPRRVAQIQDIGGVGDAFDWGMETLGSLAPFAVEAATSAAIGTLAGSTVEPGGGSVVGGLAGAFSKNAMRKFIRDGIAKGLTKEEIRREVLKLGGKSVVEKGLQKEAIKQLGAKIGMGGFSMGVESGGMWGEMMNEGIDNPTTAALFGMASGSLDLMGGQSRIIEQVLGKTAKQAFENDVKRGALRSVAQRILQAEAVQQAKGEGLQEMGQEVLGLANQWANDPDFQWLTDEHVSQVLNAGAAGSLGGFVTGFGTGLMNRSDYKAPEKTPDAPATVEPTVDLLDSQPKQGMPTVPLESGVEQAQGADGEMNLAPVGSTASQSARSIPGVALQDIGGPLRPLGQGVEQTPTESIMPKVYSGLGTPPPIAPSGLPQATMDTQFSPQVLPTQPLDPRLRTPAPAPMNRPTIPMSENPLGPVMPYTGLRPQPITQPTNIPGIQIDPKPIGSEARTKLPVGGLLTDPAMPTRPLGKTKQQAPVDRPGVPLQELPLGPVRPYNERRLPVYVGKPITRPGIGIGEQMQRPAPEPTPTPVPRRRGAIQLSTSQPAVPPISLEEYQRLNRQKTSELKRIADGLGIKAENLTRKETVVAIAKAQDIALPAKEKAMDVPAPTTTNKDTTDERTEERPERQQDQARVGVRGPGTENRKQGRRKLDARLDVHGKNELLKADKPEAESTPVASAETKASPDSATVDRLMSDFYRFSEYAGPRMADTRKRIMEAILGRKVTREEAGLNKFQQTVMDHYGAKRDTGSGMDEQVREAIAGNRAAKDAESVARATATVDRATKSTELLSKRKAEDTVEKTQIGRKWQSADGERQVVGERTVNGEPRLAVKTGEKKKLDLVKPAELDAMVEADEKATEKEEPAKANDPAVTSLREWADKALPVNLLEKGQYRSATREMVDDLPALIKDDILSLSQAIRAIQDGDFSSAVATLQELMKFGDLPAKTPHQGYDGRAATGFLNDYFEPLSNLTEELGFSLESKLPDSGASKAESDYVTGVAKWLRGEMATKPSLDSSKKSTVSKPTEKATPAPAKSSMSTKEIKAKLLADVDAALETAPEGETVVFEAGNAKYTIPNNPKAIESFQRGVKKMVTQIKPDKPTMPGLPGDKSPAATGVDAMVSEALGTHGERGKALDYLKAKLKTETDPKEIKKINEAIQGLPRFSLDVAEPSRASGLTVDEVTAAIGTVPDAVKIVATPKDLPNYENLSDKYRDRARGLWEGDTVYLVASNIDSADRAVRTMLHELIGHKGFGEVLGFAKKYGLLDRLWKERGTNGLDAIIRDYGLNPNLKMHQDIAVEEYIARMAESGKYPSWWGQAIASVREWLREHGIDIAYSDADINAILGKAAKLYRVNNPRPDGPNGGGRFDVRKAVTPDMDRAYMDAVKRGDTKAAQAMVDEAAKAAGYEPKRLYHGTVKKGFTTFNPEKIGSATDNGWFGHAFWFSDDKGYAATNYADEYRGKVPDYAEVKEVYLRMDNPKTIPWVDESERTRRVADPKQATADAKAEGFDGLKVVKNPKFGEWYEYGAFDPSQIKSADAITYDDAGNVIPLSERFNSTNDDIRFDVRSLSDIEKQWDELGIKHSITEDASEISLNKIVAPESARESGTGTKAMDALVAYADRVGKRIVLTASSDFGGNKNRLTEFYKRFGFAENKGRNKDFTTRAGMIREPSSVRYSLTPEQENAEYAKVAKGRTVLDITKGKAREAGKTFKKAVERSITPVSNRLRQIDAGIHQKFLELFGGLERKDIADLAKSQPFLKAINKMDPADARMMHYAMAIADGKKITELADKYGMQEEVANVRELLDDFIDRYKKAGIPVTRMKDYFPRRVKDVRGLITWLKGNDNWSFISKELDRQANVKGRALLPEEVEQIVNNQLRGVGPSKSQIGLGAPSNVKESRKLVHLPAEAYMRFYEPMPVALEKYITEGNKALVWREFLGKHSTEIEAVEKKAKAAASALKRWREALKAAISDDNIEAEKTARQKLNYYETILDDASATLETLKNPDGLAAKALIENSIGLYTNELAASGNIAHEKEEDLRRIMTALYQDKKPSGLMGSFRSLGYIDAMGQFGPAITQIGDMAWSLFENGMANTVKAAGQSIKRQYKGPLSEAGISVDDIVRDIGDEFRDDSFLAHVLNKTFTYTGLRAIDRMGKETLMNASIAKSNQLIAKARAGDKKAEAEIRRRLEETVGTAWEKTMADLEAGELTDNVKQFAFSTLSKFQPVTQLETPEHYLNGGNWRIVYMLKSYQLKQLGVFQRELYRKFEAGHKEFKTGDKKKGREMMLKSSADTVRLLTLLAMAGATANALKDLLYGRPVDPAELLFDSGGQLLGLSRWDIYNAKKEGIQQTIYKRLLPPHKLIDSLYKDIVSPAKDDKGSRFANSIPLVGGLYYWHLGRGSKMNEKAPKGGANPIQYGFGGGFGGF